MKKKRNKKLDIFKQKRVLGLSLIIVSFLITIPNLTMTGAVISTTLSSSISLLSIILFAIGIILTTSKYKNYAQEILENRRYVDNPREMIQIATKCGYTLDRGYREGAKVLNGKDIITVIPTNHPKINRGVSKSILEALASGESSFRKSTA